MKKKIIVPAIVSIFFLVVVLLIRSNKKQSSVTVPEITLVYAENQVEDYPTSKGAYEFAMGNWEMKSQLLNSLSLAGLIFQECLFLQYQTIFQH